MEALRGQLQRGSLVAGYRIVELISRGGMGVIYRATDSTTSRVYALKVLAPELVDDEEFRQRFTREMRIAASLRHPNVVTVHEADECEGLVTGDGPNRRDGPEAGDATGRAAGSPSRL